MGGDDELAAVEAGAVRNELRELLLPLRRLLPPPPLLSLILSLSTGS